MSLEGSTQDRSCSPLPPSAFISRSPVRALGAQYNVRYSPNVVFARVDIFAAKALHDKPIISITDRLSTRFIVRVIQSTVSLHLRYL